jgi:hypothetical protein
MAKGLTFVVLIGQQVAATWDAVQSGAVSVPAGYTDRSTTNPTRLS